MALTGVALLAIEALLGMEHGNLTGDVESPFSLALTAMATVLSVYWLYQYHNSISASQGYSSVEVPLAGRRGSRTFVGSSVNGPLPVADPFTMKALAMTLPSTAVYLSMVV